MASLLASLLWEHCGLPLTCPRPFLQMFGRADLVTYAQHCVSESVIQQHMTTLLGYLSSQYFSIFYSGELFDLPFASYTYTHLNGQRTTFQFRSACATDWPKTTPSTGGGGTWRDWPIYNSCVSDTVKRYIVCIYIYKELYIHIWSFIDIYIVIYMNIWLYIHMVIYTYGYIYLTIYTIYIFAVIYI